MNSTHTDQFALPRRGVLGLGALAGLCLATASGSAAEAGSGTRGPFGPLAAVTDLGPGCTNFSLAAGIPVGDRVYVASRNIDPMQIVGYDLRLGTVTSVTPGPGISTQLLAADPSGRYLYSAIYQRGGAEPGFIRLDLSQPDAPKEDLADLGQLSPYAMAMAPDGVLYFGGQETGDEKSPLLRIYDQDAGVLTTIAGPDPNVPMIRSLVATESLVYIGTGASLGATPTSSRAGLFALDRATGAYTSILPPEFADAVEVRDLMLDGDRLFVCSTTSEGGAVAVLDVANPGTYTLHQTDRSFLRLPRLLGDKLYANGGGALVELDLTDGASRVIDLPDSEFGEIWGLWIRDGKVMVVSAFGLVFEVDPQAQAAVVHDLVAGGAPTGPQLGMSIAADLNGVYVGGTNSVMYHDLGTGSQRRILATSEAKDVLIREGVGYFAQYNQLGVLGYDPRTDGEWPRHLADFAPEQNRPHQIVWDDLNGVALIGLQSDTASGGSLMTFDPVTNATTAVVNPIDGSQMVRAIAVAGGIAYLGGQNVGNTGGTVVAWDVQRRAELWRLTPQSRPTGVTGLAVVRGCLHVMCHRGDYFVIDLQTRAVVHASKHGAVVPNYGTLLVRRGRVFCTSASTFMTFDPRTFERTDLVELNAEWYGIPRSALDPRGRFYALRGRNLIRIEVSGV